MELDVAMEYFTKFVTLKKTICYPFIFYSMQFYFFILELEQNIIKYIGKTNK